MVNLLAKHSHIIIIKHTQPWNFSLAKKFVNIDSCYMDTMRMCGVSNQQHSQLQKRKKTRTHTNTNWCNGNDTTATTIAHFRLVLCSWFRTEIQLIEKSETFMDFWRIFWVVTEQNHIRSHVVYAKYEIAGKCERFVCYRICLWMRMVLVSIHSISVMPIEFGNMNKIGISVIHAFRFWHSSILMRTTSFALV